MSALKHILPFLFLLIAMSGQSQQVYRFSQYLQNLYILNPASAGVNDYMDLSMSYRKQWVGINNSPTTVYASLNTALGKKTRVNAKESSMRISTPTTYDQYERKSFHALGGYVANDSYGAFGITLIGASYAFHLPLSKSHTISFSPSVAYFATSFDQNKAKVEIAGDPTYASYVGQSDQSHRLDVNLSFWFYHARYFLGYSSDQLMQDRLELSNQITFSEVQAQHNLIAGYRFRIRNAFVLTPSVMARYTVDQPLGADFNLRLDYEDRIWGGMSYQTGNNLIVMAGLYVSNTLRVGYSFDYAFTTLKQYRNIGTHEVMIGLNLFNKEKVVF